jgi:hypothetical protein
MEDMKKVRIRRRKRRGEHDKRKGKSRGRNRLWMMKGRGRKRKVERNNLRCAVFVSSYAIQYTIPPLNIIVLFAWA